ncbi:MAG TPA: phage portal protein [Xanthobacteraceae bacterium]|nr:phage portal protein [Xanthobacteraceae bacterium]
MSAGAEARISLENPQVSLSDPAALRELFGAWYSAANGIEVTPAKALSVPAVLCAVSFIGGTIASLPLDLYKVDQEKGPMVDESNPLYTIIHDEVNSDCLTSFKWRQVMMNGTLLTGRSFSYIERNVAQRVVNLWPLNPKGVTIRRKNGRTFYDYRETQNTRLITYEAPEIIDIPFLLDVDVISHINLVSNMRDTFALCIAAQEYATKYFANGGVPPLALKGPAATAAAVKRAANDVLEAVRDANAQNRNMVYLPGGHELTPVGFNPEQGQLLLARLFQIQEVARIYNLPPTFLHDLSRATYSNAEQADLSFVKHTLMHWLTAIEQELNAKLFSARNRKAFVKFNQDELLRGDFMSRMEGYSNAVSAAVLSPNEARAKEGLPPLPGGDKLYINSASVPLESAGQQQQQKQDTGAGKKPVDQGQPSDKTGDK